MKTVLILAGLIALTFGGTLPHAHQDVKTKPIDPKLVEVQHKVLYLFENLKQEYPEGEYYKIGHEYDVEAHIDKYKNKEVVTKFMKLYKTGFMPKDDVFSIFYETQAEEAIALYNLFYYASDFETFYKTACFAKVWMNQGQFLYAFYMAILQRDDCRGIVVPPPYEIWPEYFINQETITKLFRVQMQKGFIQPERAIKYGMFTEDDYYYFYANYSGPAVYESDEYMVSYLTEDIGWNSYYYYFHTQMPFWGKGEDILGPFKERRGEIYFYFYQQLLARYYLERLSNGLSEIPKFSWWTYFTTPYYPWMTSTWYPFAQRGEHYYLPSQQNLENIQFLDTYEKSFLQFLQKGQFKAYKQDVDLYNSKSVNFIGNYWQANWDLYDKVPHRHYYRSYERIARRILGGAPITKDRYSVIPSVLDFYQTSLRDPAFYQLYSKIMDYIIQYKEYLEPYTQDVLHYSGVKVNDVHVDKLETFFDYYDFNASNVLYWTNQELETGAKSFMVRQPRLNHKPFNVVIDVKSDVEAEAVFKVFMGPKYDSQGHELSLEDNWMNFVELDWFTHKLTPGQNKIERKSDEFFFYKDDSISWWKIEELLKQNKVPTDMSENFKLLPRRLMLPRGHTGGFSYQFFVFVYPYQPPVKEWEVMKSYVLDNKPFGYPFDRPVTMPYYFVQPNMYFKDVKIYHDGEEYPWWYHPTFWNTVTKH